MSNRGEDTIAVLAIEPGTGRIRLTQSMPCGGKTPRFFALTPDGRFMHVLNEDSDSIVTMVVDEHSGMLTAMGRKLSPQLLSSTWISEFQGRMSSRLHHQVSGQPTLCIDPCVTKRRLFRLYFSRDMPLLM